MKRILLSIILAVLTLAGCSSTASPVVTRTAEDFSLAIQNARDAELNEAIPVVTSFEDEYISTLLGISGDDVDSCAIAVSAMNIKAYGIALVRPIDGKEEDVRGGLLRFIDMQKQNFERYLEDQYHIAESAKLDQLSDGTFLLVMCENSDHVFDAIKASLE